MTAVLRPDVLAGVGVTVVGGSRFGAAVRARAAALGARDGSAAPDDGGAAPDEGRAALVVDVADARDGRAALDAAWDAIQPAAAALIDAGDGGLIVLLAPPPGDPRVEAARAGLENLARTLSIEWARHAIRPVAILPGAATSPAAAAELACFLASPAGGYYAGCALALGSATAA